MAYITVKGPGEDRKVILWEKDDAHPIPKGSDKGEVLIVNDGKEYKVGATPAIKRLILEEKLIKVDGKPDKEAKDKSDKKPSDSEPFDGYDALSVEEVLARARELDDVGRAKVLAYERANKKRAGVIQTYVNWNS